MNWVTSFSHLLLVLPLALLPSPPPTLGIELVLAKVGEMVELPCKASQKIMPFAWHRPPHSNILKRHGNLWTTGISNMNGRVESKKSLWDQGSFPLIISQLKVEDSGLYTCEVMGKKLEVDLMVFKVNASSSIHLLSGQSLTLTVEGPTGKGPYFVQWKGPQDKERIEGMTLSLAQMELKHSGPWTCSMTYGKKTLEFHFKIQVQGFLDATTIIYGRAQEKVLFHFPLNLEVRSLKGMLSWQPERPSSPKACVRFSLEDKKVTVTNASLQPKFLVEENLPLRVTLPLAKPEHAGSGKLFLNLTWGVLLKEVKLVVMTVIQSQNNLLCEVWGPTPNNMQLNLSLVNHTVSFLSQHKQVKVVNPEVGTWQCLLSAEGAPLVDFKLEVTSTSVGAPLLTIVLGGAAAFLFLSVLCVFCCVKCWHRRRQAERMSQIKRLLREKKTCQCSHRLQKM
ncbi:T-cell surface glycoprotein CD4 [Erinaceus europaeus]|uniref:T-cell surface glycoprotein CD4 n=1 Tax=Erinaceus europaeus TaxID=9365 RepID=A0A1S3WTS2_ERIEU|nr:T-cell surface glycoprotein CD4 [Erinaceus europaeus]